MGYEEGMSLPMSAFWLLSNSIGRITAERDRMALRVAIAAQSAEASNQLMEQLTEQLGEVARYDKPKAAMAVKMDRAGFEALRAMQG